MERRVAISRPCAHTRYWPRVPAFRASHRRVGTWEPGPEYLVPIGFAPPQGWEQIVDGATSIDGRWEAVVCVVGLVANDPFATLPRTSALVTV